MNKQTRISYEWALNEQYPSIAATHAKGLAEYIRDGGCQDRNILLEYAYMRAALKDLVHALAATKIDARVEPYFRHANALLLKEK